MVPACRPRKRVTGRGGQLAAHQGRFLPESPTVQTQRDEVRLGPVGLSRAEQRGSPRRDCESGHGGYRGSVGAQSLSRNSVRRGQVEVALELRGVRCPGRRQVFGEGLLPQSWSPFPAHPQRHSLHPELEQSKARVIGSENVPTFWCTCSESQPLALPYSLGQTLGGGT